LPSRDEIVEAIKYLKDNKAAGSELIVAELLKSGRPSLVNALNEMIQQVWIGESLTESLIEGVLFPVYKKSDKLDCKNCRGIYLLNVAFQIFANVLHSSLLPSANAAVLPSRVPVSPLSDRFWKKATH
jgi:hypothetical protein